MAGATWRHLRRSVGDPCRECGRCDLGVDGHRDHQCTVASAWFAGVVTVCERCFARIIREELLARDVELVGVPERVARGDADAVDELRRLTDTDGAS